MIMEIDSVGKKEGVLNLIIIILLFFLALQIHGMSIDPNIVESYPKFYSGLALLGIIGMSAVTFFDFLETEELQIIHGIYSKIGVHAVWILLLFLMTTSVFGQILPVPRASQVDFQLDPSMEFWTSSVIPAVTEDTVYLFLLPMVIFMGFVLGGNLLGADITGQLAVIFLVIACLISSTGYGFWIVPGFTSMHQNAYGQQPDNYFGAWIFATGQSLINVFTGAPIMIAHGLHNYMIYLSRTSQFNIGLLQIT